MVRFNTININTLVISKNNFKINFILIISASLLTIISYLSFYPIIIGFFFFTLGNTVLSFNFLGGDQEKIIFNRIYLIGFLVAGISSIYANFLNDYIQLTSDPYGFFEMSISDAKNLKITEIQILYEGAFAIYIWRSIYDFFFNIGFEKERYIGILFNVFQYAMTAVVALKITKNIYGNDLYRFKLLKNLFSFCGVFWLFSSIHIRDVMILLILTLLTYIWINFLSNRKDFKNVNYLILSNILISIIIFFLRGEFLFIPFIFLILYVLTIIKFSNEKKKNILFYIFILLCITIIFYIGFEYGSKIIDILKISNEGYRNLSDSVSSTNSLGMKIIVNQPIPIRLFLGSIYLFIFPIPIWSGFQLNSVYFLYISLNTIFFIFFIPLLFLSFKMLFIKNNLKLFFLLTVSISFIFAISITSLEIRHLGVFLVPLFLVALYPNLRVKKTLVLYKKYLLFYFTFLVIIHLSWLLLKFLN